MMGWGKKKSQYESYWAPYVPVSERKKNAAKHIDSMKKKGQQLNPVVIDGRTIAKSFWGKAWCENLEAYSDYSNRLPRGRTYVRNGSVIDLQITPGQIAAQVMGSSLYKITITINSMVKNKWNDLVKSCSGKIDSLIELLQGLFSKSVMEVMIEKETGLFPKPKEISMKCSCPDSAGLCKHLAAVLYGVGSMLDAKPEWLFTLRNVDPADLIASADTSSALIPAAAANALEESDLSTLFGIELETSAPSVKPKVKAGAKAKVKASPPSSIAQARKSKASTAKASKDQPAVKTAQKRIKKEVGEGPKSAVLSKTTKTKTLKS